MRKKSSTNFHLLSMVPTVAIAVSVTFFACSSSQSHQINMDKAMSYLNKKEYAKAEEILEDEHRSAPDNKKISLLLSQAELGMAGFEMIEFANTVLAKQNPSEYVDLAVKPSCDDETIEKIQGYDIRCLLYRVMEHLPNPDNEHFKKAESLLRQTFPDAVWTPTEVNFLIAFVELGSGLARIRKLLTTQVYSKPDGMSDKTNEDRIFQLIVHNVKLIFDEAHEGFLRLRYSYRKLNQFVVNLNGKPLLRIGNDTLAFSDSTGINDFLKFAAVVIHHNAEKIDNQLSQIVADQLNQMGPGALKLIQAVDLASFSGDGSMTLQIGWHFAAVLDRLITAALNSNDDVHVDFVQAAWSNPPRILKNLAEAASDAWNSENPEPLRRYYLSTKGQWTALEAIIGEWEGWYGGLSDDQRNSIYSLFHAIHDKDPRVGPPSPDLPISDLGKWQNDFASGLIMGIKPVFTIQTSTGESSSVDLSLSKSQIDAATQYFDETMKWTDENLWPVQ